MNEGSPGSQNPGGLAVYNEDNFDMESIVLRRADPDDCD